MCEVSKFILFRNSAGYQVDVAWSGFVEVKYRDVPL